MNFSDALELIKKGELLSRTGLDCGWHNKEMFVFLVSGSQFKVNRAPLLGIFPEGTEINYNPHIDIKYHDGTIGIWTPSMNDLMAEDWIIHNGIGHY